MSAARQRRGEKEETSTSENKKTGAEILGVPWGAEFVLKERRVDELYMNGGNFKDMAVEDILRMTVMQKSKPTMPSMSNATKEVKDKLETDPYSISLIKDLGLRYFVEMQWDLCANVLMRGWKRVNELTDANDRFIFLMKLAEASYRDLKFKQAHAIVMDIEVPEDKSQRMSYLLLATQIHGQTGDAQKALQCFSKAIDGEKFEVSINVWAATALALRKVDAFEASKNAVVNKVRSGPKHFADQQQIRTVESWSIMSITQEEPQESIVAQLAEGKVPTSVLKAACAVLVLLTLIMLYIWEQRSLKKHGIK